MHPNDRPGDSRGRESLSGTNLEPAADHNERAADASAVGAAILPIVVKLLPSRVVLMKTLHKR